MKKKFQKVQQVAEFLDPMNISIHSAYTCFFLVLSLFPILVILFGILAYTPLGLEELLDLLEEFLPAAFMPLAERMMEGAYTNTSGTMVSISALTALWSAGMGMRGLLTGLNAVYGRKENRSYLAIRGISALYTLLFLLVLVLTLVIHVFGEAIVDFLRMTTNPFMIFLMDMIDGRFLLMLLIQVTLFATMYALLPSKNNGLLDSVPGAVFSAAGWMVCSKLFSVYVEHFPKYANIYGSFYAAALAMMWLYCCISILFYGAALNRWLMDRKKKGKNMDVTGGA